MQGSEKKMSERTYTTISVLIAILVTIIGGMWSYQQVTAQSVQMQHARDLAQDTRMVETNAIQDKTIVKTETRVEILDEQFKKVEDRMIRMEEQDRLDTQKIIDKIDKFHSIK